jgi:ankyrin repeat protein
MSEDQLLAHTYKGDTAAVIGKMLAKGMNPNVRDSLGQTPLMFAAGNGDAAVVGLLLQHGADAAAKDRFGDTALHLAARIEDHIHLSIGGRICAREHAKSAIRLRNEACHEACIVQLAHSCPSAIDVRGMNGETPLIAAVGLPSHVAALLRFGPRLDLKDDSGMTALANGRAVGAKVTIQLLEAAGARE